MMRHLPLLRLLLQTDGLGKRALDGGSAASTAFVPFAVVVEHIVERHELGT